MMRKGMSQNKVRLIVFSSEEKLPLAKAIQRNLYTEEYAVTVWTDSFFAFSCSYISSFKSLKSDYDFAVVICGKDDTIQRRGEQKSIPRDNILLELGMCVSCLSLEHTLIVQERGVSLPSDLGGISPIEFSIADGEMLDTVAGTICAKIESHLASHRNQSDFIKLSWDEYFHTMKEMVGRLQQSPRCGGYIFDAIVAVNRGGLMVADMISRERNTDVPILPLFPDRRSAVPDFDTPLSCINNAELMKLLDEPSVQNVLLVDSFSRKGDTIMLAKKYLMKCLPNKNIRALVIYANTCLKNTAYGKQIDYVGAYRQLDGRKLKLSW